MVMYMLPSFLERPNEWVRRECMLSSKIMASVGSKQAVEDTVTDTQMEHFIIIAVQCIFQCLVTVTAMQGRPRVSRDQNNGQACMCVCIGVCVYVYVSGHKSNPYLIVVTVWKV